MLYYAGRRVDRDCCSGGEVMASVLPLEALNSHLAILGKTGSGKTTTAKQYVEKLLDKKKRVCVIDPTGAWYGLKSSADGKKAAYPVVIFGGDHADFPIGRDHGAALAEIVATTDTPAIIDTSVMSIGDRTKFFTDFAETLLRKNREPLHLVIDEAHNFAPQGKVPDPQAGKMIHATNNLLSMGRSRGLSIMMISQRPQKLHKDSLTQAATLIAMQLIHNLDRKSVEDWIGENVANPAQGKEIMKSLATLERGTGWIWSPEYGILEKTKFPMIKTYDSSSAPNGSRKKIVLAEIDMKSIESKLQTATSQIIEDDPKRLRARIAELEKAQPKPVIDQERIDRAREKGYSTGWRKAMEAVSQFSTSAINDNKPPVVSQNSATIRQSVVEVKKPGVSAHKENASLNKAEIKFLTVMTQRGTPLTRNKIAIFSGYSVKSGHIDNTLGGLRSKGYASGGNSAITITQAGLDALGAYQPMPTGAELRQYWINEMDKAGATFLGILYDIYPGTISRNDLAERAGYSPQSGHVDNTLGKLRSFELAVGRNDAISASSDLF